LGLTRINSFKILEDTPAIRGMANKVAHLIQLEETDQ
jgi:ribosomal protein L30